MLFDDSQLFLFLTFLYIFLDFLNCNLNVADDKATLCILTDGVEPGPRPLPHRSESLILRLTAAHGYLHRSRRERPVGEPRQRRDDSSSRHWRPRDRKCFDVKMVVLVTAMNDGTDVRDTYEPEALCCTALYEIGTGVNEL